jgi:hypothetical protein
MGGNRHVRGSIQCGRAREGVRGRRGRPRTRRWTTAARAAADTPPTGARSTPQATGFFVVSGGAANALRPAIAVQRHHASTAWPDRGVVRVRIGLHTGEVRLASGDYVGLDVHRAAGICAVVAHGGQVIVSETTKRLLRSGFPPPRALARPCGPAAGWPRRFGGFMARLGVATPPT